MSDDVQANKIDYPVNGGTVPGYLARPASGAKQGVVVIQEWWGLNHHIQAVARRFAEAGYAALAPDLYHGEVTAEPDEAHKMMMELNMENALQEVQGAVEYLMAQDNLGRGAIGVVGFCMGGYLAASMALHGEHIGAVSSFYGGGFNLNDATTAQIKHPLLAIYGQADSGIPMTVVHNNEAMLRKHGKTHRVVTYAGAPHAFFNDTRESYRQDAAEDAWQETLNWFNEHLK